LSFSKHVSEIDEFRSSSIELRLIDLHEAFLDKNVKAILPTIGGFNSNQLLKYIDYKLIKRNPKILCGYSDITALSNAIYAKTGLVSYSGPLYSTFGIKYGNEYTQENFKKCLMSEKKFKIEPSEKWSDDAWYIDQEKRDFIKNEGWNIINPGKAKGTIVGGNLCTFNLLQGTEFMPSLKNTILFIEDDADTNPVNFDRNLQSLIHQPGFNQVKAIIIGRFQKQSKISNETLKKILSTKKELQEIPIISNIDFGHTSPIITYPIGGKININITELNNPLIEIIKH
jgi:muramoyltetrapeptide carboxypeptidase LdcA involved in peptidoglycan recycling